MTIVEFYDKYAVENVAGALLCNPERLILVGKNLKKMERSKQIYRELFESRGLQTEILCRPVQWQELGEITDTLAALVEEYPDCRFDLSGGEDLYLVAVGQILARYGDRVSYQRMNHRVGSLVGNDAVGALELTAEECIRLCGGELVTDGDGAINTYDWQFDPEFEKDIDAMWSICRHDARGWNAHVNTVGAIDQRMGGAGPDLCFDVEDARALLKRGGVRYACSEDTLKLLEEQGLIRNLRLGDTVSFTFKNPQVKRCLTVAGQVLELVIARKMRALQDEKGRPLYHDVRVGVVINWDADGETEGAQTLNEIDVLAMKDTVPVFISCKNGMFDVNELYKLNTVAQRFGGPLAKKALAATELEKLGDRAEFLRARMDDMGIRRVENVDEISDKELDRILRSLWSN